MRRNLFWLGLAVLAVAVAGSLAGLGGAPANAVAQEVAPSPRRESGIEDHLRRPDWLGERYHHERGPLSVNGVYLGIDRGELEAYYGGPRREQGDFLVYQLKGGRKGPGQSPEVMVAREPFASTVRGTTLQQGVITNGYLDRDSYLILWAMGDWSASGSEEGFYQQQFSERAVRSTFPGSPSGELDSQGSGSLRFLLPVHECVCQVDFERGMARWVWLRPL